MHRSTLDNLVCPRCHASLRLVSATAWLDHDRLRAGAAEASYVASLAAKGRGKIAQKLGEEAVETVIAAVAQGPDALAAESADLLYHWLALMAASGVFLDAVAEKLEAREGTSGIAEKASRKG